MKLCNDCKLESPDDAPFCITCGSSFGLKLCPHLHPNPRMARYCRTCGSRDLSQPHPIRPPTMGKKLFVVLLMAAVTLLATLFFLTTLSLTPRW